MNVAVNTFLEINNTVLISAKREINVPVGLYIYWQYLKQERNVNDPSSFS
tara:strand:+ start:943 stop:1092 length:150 start_codon:yes stop_codon:yes gene_type:complete